MPNADPHRNYWSDPDGFLQEQARISLEQVDEALAAHAPAHPEPPARRLALLLLDQVLHHEPAPRWPCVQQFHHRRVQRAVGQIAAARVERGMAIWKLYDHGFVVRTPSLCLGFDLARGESSGVAEFAVAAEVTDRLASACDVLFISHDHDDHADPVVVEQFQARGKPVIAPPQVLAGAPCHAGIQHLPRSAHRSQSVPLGQGRPPLDVVLYPGHQGAELDNNVPLITTPEGYGIAHTGDQAMGEDFAWIDTVAAHHRVDLLMPNCWTGDLARVVQGFGASMVLTGHENELGHSIDHREPYWLTYDRIAPVHAPCVLMTWGERFLYDPQSTEAT